MCCVRDIAFVCMKGETLNMYRLLKHFILLVYHFFSCHRIPYDIIDQLIPIRIRNQLFWFAVYYAESGGKLTILIICPIAFLVCSHRKGKTTSIHAICSFGEF